MQKPPWENDQQIQKTMQRRQEDAGIAQSERLLWRSYCIKIAGLCPPHERNLTQFGHESSQTTDETRAVWILQGESWKKYLVIQSWYRWKLYPWRGKTGQRLGGINSHAHRKSSFLSISTMLPWAWRSSRPFVLLLRRRPLKRETLVWPEISILSSDMHPIMKKIIHTGPLFIFWIFDQWRSLRTLPHFSSSKPRILLISIAKKSMNSSTNFLTKTIALSAKNNMTPVIGSLASWFTVDIPSALLASKNFTCIL